MIRVATCTTEVLKKDYKDIELLKAHDMICVKHLKLQSLNFARFILSVY